MMPMAKFACVGIAAKFVRRAISVYAARREAKSSAAENYNACEVVQYLCPECKVVTTVAWSVDTATDSVECECGSRAQIILPQNKRKDKLCKTQATE